MHIGYEITARTSNVVAFGRLETNVQFQMSGREMAMKIVTKLFVNSYLFAKSTSLWYCILPYINARLGQRHTKILIIST